jgi:hypothetical protein
MCSGENNSHLACLPDLTNLAAHGKTGGECFAINVDIGEYRNAHRSNLDWFMKLHDEFLSTV